MRDPRIPGYVLIALCGLMGCFQLMLALGINIPGAAWGGRYEVLPAELRFASFTAACIFILLIFIVLEKLGKITLIRKPGLVNAVLWFFGVYFLLNTVMNAISPGSIEKYFMTPLALILSVLCIIMARKKPLP